MTVDDDYNELRNQEQTAQTRIIINLCERILELEKFNKYLMEFKYKKVNSDLLDQPKPRPWGEF